MKEINEDIKIPSISESDIPMLIQKQFAILNEYTSSIEIAKKKASEINRQAVNSQEKGVHIFKMKNSIENLQANQVALSESNKINTELQEKSLEYQKKLSEIMKYLLGLGVANITMNRCIVKELMMRLNDAAEEEIDEMARSEILSVIKQLKEQEDLYLKTTEITGKVKDHDNKLMSQEFKDIEHDEMIRILSDENTKIQSSISKLQASNKKMKRIYIFIGVLALISFLIALFNLIILFTR